MFELSQVFDSLRMEIKDICNRDILQKVIKKTLYFYNFKQVNGDVLIDEMVINTDPKNSPDSKDRYIHSIWKAVQEDKWAAVYIDVYMQIIDKISKDAKSPFRDDYDYRCTLQIIPMKAKTLVMYFGNPMLRDYMESRHDLLIDYHYQNQTDQPDDISDAEWDMREKDWDKAIGPDYIPKQHGFTVDLFDTDNIMPIFVPSKAKPVSLPDIEHQMYSIRNTLCSIADVQGCPKSQRYSDWLAFTESKPYKQWVSDCNKMIQKKCKFITSFNEFCELVTPKKG